MAAFERSPAITGRTHIFARPTNVPHQPRVHLLEKALEASLICFNDLKSSFGLSTSQDYVRIAALTHRDIDPFNGILVEQCSVLFEPLAHIPVEWIREFFAHMIYHCQFPLDPLVGTVMPWIRLVKKISKRALGGTSAARLPD
jgi:hypothetical protein